MKPAAAYMIVTELWSDGVNRTRPGEGKFAGYRTMVYTPKAVGHTTRLGKIISRSYGRWDATVSAADAVAAHGENLAALDGVRGRYTVDSLDADVAREITGDAVGGYAISLK